MSKPADLPGAPRRYALDKLPATPWKNGGGTTREVACWPPGAGLDDFAWRVSIASIAAAGPFSAFPGVDRTIVLLEGAGVALQAADGSVAHRLDTPLAPYAFSGDAAIDCALLGGPSTDFNVMTRRGRVQARVQVVRGATALRPAPHGVLLAAAGTWSVIAESGLPVQTCRQGEGLWWAGSVLDAALVPATGDAAMLAVCIDAA